MARSCLRIRPPVSSTKASVRFTKASRPMSKRVWPSLARSFSTTFCVAMPAWSVPGTQSVSSPAMRRQRMRTSCTVLLSPCPTCSTAVTFGGGMMIVNGSRSPPARVVRPASARKSCAASQASLRADSAERKSKWVGNSGSAAASAPPAGAAESFCLLIR